MKNKSKIKFNCNCLMLNQKLPYKNNLILDQKNSFYSKHLNFCQSTFIKNNFNFIINLSKWLNFGYLFFFKNFLTLYKINNFKFGYLYCCFILISFQRILFLNAQRIDTKSQNFERKVGDNIELPCSFEEINLEDKVIVWKRGLDVLAIDEDLTIRDNRFKIKRDGLNYVLSITSLEPYDSANYTCSVTSNPPVEITHTLNVTVPPSAKLIPTNSPLFVRNGDEVAIRCSGTGNPLPTISWSKQNSNNEEFLNKINGQLLIPKITPKHAGLYECRVSNGIGHDAIAVVEIRVESENLSTDEETENVEKKFQKNNRLPWVETDRLYIPATIGSSINLSCRYDGEPEPIAEWLFSGFKINKFDKKFKSGIQSAQRFQNYTLSIFEIKNVQEDHFGDYTCKISNALGSIKTTIHLSDKPSPPILVINNDKTLSWTVQSIKPISSYKIFYRLASEDTWTNYKIVPALKDDQQGDDNWQHKIKLDFLETDTDYEIQVSAQNDLGWGSLARNFVKYKFSSKDGKVISTSLTDSNHSSNVKNKNLLVTIISTVLFIMISKLLN